MTNSIRQSIGFTLLIYVCSSFIALTLLLAAYQMYYEFKTTKEQVEDILEKVEQAFKSPIAVSIWSFNTKSISIIAKSITKFEAISGVEILDDQGKTLASSGTIPEKRDFGDLARRFTVLYQEDGETDPTDIGAVCLFSSNKIIWAMVKRSFMLIVFNAIIEAAFLMLVSYFIINRIVARPMEYFSNLILDIKNKKEANLKIIRDKMEVLTSRKDELGQLSTTFVEMYSAVKDLTDHLEQKVDMRTKQIEDAQKKMMEQDKMASLGQLITGLAHELNNPLGAISSSVGNVSLSFEILLPQLPLFFSTANFKDIDLMKVLMETSKSYKRETTKEIRKKRDFITEQLEAADFKSPDALARLLVPIIPSDKLIPLIPFLKAERSKDVIKLVNSFHSINRMISNIYIAAQRMSKITFILKAYIQMDKEKVGWRTFEYGDVIEGIEAVITIYETQFTERLSITKNFDPVPNTQLLTKEVEQVWINLLQNSFQAVQALEDQGSLDISVKKDQDNENILVTFTDNGIGIPKENHPNIFQAFFTTKGHGEGVGLGLHICQKIIKMHGGEITFDSVPGRTSFIVKIPIREKSS